MVRWRELLTTSIPPPIHRSYPEEDKWHGDQIKPHKSPGHTRVMFHNVRGLSLEGPECLDIFTHDQSSLQVDIQAISEHCLDTTKFLVTQQIQEKLMRQHPGKAVAQFNSSSEPAVATYKPGGTAMLVLGNHISRVEPNGKGGDPLGRWSYIHFRRQNLPPLTFISAYQVCPRPTNAMGNTAYHQQTRLLNIEGRTGVHPRKAFIDDLHAFLTHLRSKSHDIVLGGDFNETIEDRNSGLLRIATSHNLIDPFIQRFPRYKEFGTHEAGSRRIDSVLMSTRLLSSIRHIGYGPFSMVLNSDHRPLFIEFKTKELFGDAVDLLPPLPFRGVQSTDKKSTTKYIEILYDKLKSHGIFKMQKAIDDNTALVSDIEYVDNIIGISGNEADKKCGKRRPEFYSQTIVKQRIKVSILRGHLSALKTGRQRQGALESRMKRAGITIELPPTIKQTKLQLQEAESLLRDHRKNSFEMRQSDLQTQIELATKDGKKDQKRVLQAIYRSEGATKTYRILQSIRKKSSDAAKIDRIEIPASWPDPQNQPDDLNTLEHPNTCTEWRLITAPGEIEFYILLRNQLHFGQAQGTPFTISPLNQDFDWNLYRANRFPTLQGHTSKL